MVELSYIIVHIAIHIDDVVCMFLHWQPQDGIIGTFQS